MKPALRSLCTPPLCILIETFTGILLSISMNPIPSDVPSQAQHLLSPLINSTHHDSHPSHFLHEPKKPSYFLHAGLKGACFTSSQVAYSHSQSSRSSASTEGHFSGGTTLHVRQRSHCTHWSASAASSATFSWASPSACKRPHISGPE